MAYAYLDDKGTIPSAPASSAEFLERLSFARLYRDSELRGIEHAAKLFSLLDEEDQYLAKTWYDGLLIKGEIDPSPSSSPALITKGATGPYPSFLVQKSQAINRAIKRDFAFDDSDPARRQAAEKSLTRGCVF